jgi:large subunit ribosomal protein L15
MKLHDLRPAEGSHKPRTRVGRGIAAGKGKTAGRGTKGQKARTGHGSLPAWFEGGQTPIHVRLPKLRGFKNPFRIEYEIVNVGAISALAETGILDMPETEGAPSGTAKAKSGKPVPVTVTPDILAAAGLVRTLNKPLKVLGHGDVTRALFVVADAFSKSATAKIEAAGGTAQVLEFPTGDEGESEEASVPVVTAAPAKTPKAATTAETLPPTSPADGADSEA